MTHKFSAGQMVRLTATSRNRSSSSGSYKIIRSLPASEDGERSYRVKSASEPHERVLKEDELERS